MTSAQRKPYVLQGSKLTHSSPLQEWYTCQGTKGKQVLVPGHKMCTTRGLSIRLATSHSLQQAQVQGAWGSEETASHTASCSWVIYLHCRRSLTQIRRSVKVCLRRLRNQPDVDARSWSSNLPLCWRWKKIQKPSSLGEMHVLPFHGDHMPRRGGTEVTVQLLVITKTTKMSLMCWPFKCLGWAFGA